MHTEEPAVCSDIHAKHISYTMCADRRISERFNLLVHKVTTGPYRVNIKAPHFVHRMS